MVHTTNKQKRTPTPPLAHLSNALKHHHDKKHTHHFHLKQKYQRKTFAGAVDGHPPVLVIKAPAAVSSSSSSSPPGDDDDDMMVIGEEKGTTNNATTGATGTATHTHTHIQEKGEKKEKEEIDDDFHSSASSSESEFDDDEEDDGYHDDDDPMANQDKENKRKLRQQQHNHHHHHHQEGMTIKFRTTDKDKAALLEGSFKYFPLLDCTALGIVQEVRPFAAPHGQKHHLYLECAAQLNKKCAESPNKYMQACAGKINDVNLKARLDKLEKKGRANQLEHLRRSGTAEEYTERQQLVESYIEMKDTMNVKDKAMRELRKRQGYLERLQGVHMRESLMQGIVNSHSLKAKDEEEAAELGIPSRAKVKPNNFHITQKQMTEQVVAEGKRFADIASCLAKQGDGIREYLKARKEGEDTQKQLVEELKHTREAMHQTNMSIRALVEGLKTVMSSKEKGKE